MKILLDIDDTSMIINPKTRQYEEHPKLRDVLSNYEVYLYSGNPEIAEFHKKWKTKGYISKESDTYPKADVLIDDMAEQWSTIAIVKKSYTSIDDFLSSQK